MNIMKLIYIILYTEANVHEHTETSANVCTEANAYVDRLFTFASDKHDKPGCVQTWHESLGVKGSLFVCIYNDPTGTYSLLVIANWPVEITDWKRLTMQTFVVVTPVCGGVWGWVCGCGCVGVGVLVWVCGCGHDWHDNLYTKSICS